MNILRNSVLKSIFFIYKILVHPKNFFKKSGKSQKSEKIRKIRKKIQKFQRFFLGFKSAKIRIFGSEQPLAFASLSVSLPFVHRPFPPLVDLVRASSLVSRRAESNQQKAICIGAVQVWTRRAKKKSARLPFSSLRLPPTADKEPQFHSAMDEHKLGSSKLVIHRSPSAAWKTTHSPTNTHSHTNT